MKRIKEIIIFPFIFLLGYTLFSEENFEKFRKLLSLRKPFGRAKEVTKTSKEVVEVASQEKTEGWIDCLFFGDKIHRERVKEEGGTLHYYYSRYFGDFFYQKPINVKIETEKVRESVTAQDENLLEGLNYILNVLLKHFDLSKELTLIDIFIVQSFKLGVLMAIIFILYKVYQKLFPKKININ